MLVECVPNFSEGRDPHLIARLADAAAGVPGVALLDRHSDPDHHRTVLTLAGAPGAVSEAAFRAARVAVEAIDLTRHDGVHPRIGAVDVIPFVPLTGATIDDCVALAQALAQRLASELDLPIYLYAEAARRPERRRLPWLRSPGFEGLGQALATPERAPDHGPARPHPTAGATVVGARGFLVAFNVDLATQDVKLARRIARAIRESSGGMAGVQARGLVLARQGRVQVTTNLLDLGVSGPGRVFRRIAELAAAEGVAVAESELVGLMPRAALVEATHESLKVAPPPLAERVLEDRLEAALIDPAGPLPTYLGHLAGARPSDPGGGSATALGLALGRACLEKALHLSRGGKGQLGDAELDALQAGLPSAAALLELARADHVAFATLMAAWGEPKGPARSEALAAARAPAVEVPERLLAAAIQIAEAGARLAEAGNRNLVNDAVAAAELARAAGVVAALNARANQTKGARRDYAGELARLEQAAERARAAAG